MPRVFRIVDRYVLRQIFMPLAAALLISLLMLLAGRMLGFLDVTLGKKNSFTAVFKMLAYLTPNYLGLAVPAALFLGVLFGFNRMSKTHEVDAMLASGISLARMFRPVMLVSILLIAINVLAVGWLQPYGRYSYRSVIYTLTNVDAFDLAKEGIFMKSGQRTFIVDHLNQSTNSFDHLFIFDDKGSFDGSETVTANSGKLLNSDAQSSPVLRLENSSRLRIPSYPDLESKNQPQNATTAETTTADFPLDRLSSTAFRPRGADERELSLTEILFHKGPLPSGATPAKMQAELHNRLVKILSIPMLAVLALPFALAQARKPDAYRFGIAIVLLVVFNVVMEQGAIATSISGISPWLSIWLPFAAFLGFALWRFWRVSFQLKPERTNALSEWITNLGASLRQRLVR
jgi:lipopolysaccharide export system permease protein